MDVSAYAGGRLGSWEWEAAEVPISRKVGEQHHPVSGFSRALQVHQAEHPVPS